MGNFVIDKIIEWLDGTEQINNGSLVFGSSYACVQMW